MDEDLYNLLPSEQVDAFLDKAEGVKPMRRVGSTATYSAMYPTEGGFILLHAEHITTRRFPFRRQTNLYFDVLSLDEGLDFLNDMKP